MSSLLSKLSAPSTEVLEQEMNLNEKYKGREFHIVGFPEIYLMYKQGLILVESDSPVQKQTRYSQLSGIYPIIDIEGTNDFYVHSNHLDGNIVPYEDQKTYNVVVDLFELIRVKFDLEIDTIRGLHYHVCKELIEGRLDKQTLQKMYKDIKDSLMKSKDDLSLIEFNLNPNLTFSEIVFSTRKVPKIEIEQLSIVDMNSSSLKSFAEELSSRIGQMEKGLSYVNKKLSLVTQPEVYEEFDESTLIDQTTGKYVSEKKKVEKKRKFLKEQHEQSVQDYILLLDIISDVVTESSKFIFKNGDIYLIQELNILENYRGGRREEFETLNQKFELVYEDIGKKQSKFLLERNKDAGEGEKRSNSESNLRNLKQTLSTSIETEMNKLEYINWLVAKKPNATLVDYYFELK